MQGEKSKMNLCETRANFIHSQSFDSAMVRKCSFYDFYNLEEDVGLAPVIAATFVSVKDWLPATLLARMRATLGRSMNTVLFLDAPDRFLSNRPLGVREATVVTGPRVVF